MFLGISGLHHDSAICLSDYDQLLFASQEERFSRIKFDSSWPSLSLNYIVENYDFSKIEAITFYEKPSIFNKFDIKNKLKNLGYKKEIFYLEHHHSHAYSSISLNEWKPGAVMVVDSKGGNWATSLGYWDGKNLYWIKKFPYPQSLGLFYSSITKLLGFIPQKDEEKVMSAAMYGVPKWENYINSNLLTYKENSYFLLKNLTRGLGSGVLDFDIAASAQLILEKILVSLSKWLQKQTGYKTLYYSGGVALNCVANTKIKLYSGFTDIYIQPASGDAGCSVGASTFIPQSSFKTPYLGVEDSLDQSVDSLVKDLVRGNIVYHIDGKAEFGPRALGNRSFLSIPTEKNNSLLHKIKGRTDDTWRPWAPVCREEDVDNLFNVVHPSETMMFVAYTKTSNWFHYPDKSARLQIVNKNTNPKLHSIISNTSKQGFPVLINTSLNSLGKPIINYKKDLLECSINLELCGIDTSYIEKLKS